MKALHGNVRKRGQHARKHRNNKRKSKNKPSRHAKGGQNKPSRHGQGTQHRSRSKSKKKRGQERGHRGNKRNRQQLREGFNLRQNRNDTITKSNAKRNNTMDSKRDGETKRSRKHGRLDRNSNVSLFNYQLIPQSFTTNAVALCIRQCTFMCKLKQHKGRHVKAYKIVQSNQTIPVTVTVTVTVTAGSPEINNKGNN